MYGKLVTTIQNKFNIDAHYFMSGGFWLFAAQVIGAAFGLFTTILFANLLTETDYGIYRYLIAVAVLISSFSLSGIGIAILQAATKGYLAFAKDTLAVSLKYNLGVTAIAIVSSVYYLLNDNLTLTTGCALIAILQPFINSLQFAPHFLQGKKDFRLSATLLIFKSTLVSASLITSLLLFENVTVLFLTYLLSHLLFDVVSFFFVHFRTKSSPTPEPAKKKFLSYAKHTSVRNIVSNIAFRIDNILVFTQLGAAELAAFSIANALPEQIKGSFKTVSSLLLPKYANEETYEIAKKGIPRRSLQFLLILILISVTYCLAAPFIFNLLFPKYIDAVLYSQLFALIFPAYIYYLPLTAMMSELNEAQLYRFHVYTSVFQLIITILLIAKLQLLGAVLARMITQYVRSAYCYYLAFRK
jgi:O-antigen/teichoic acid export membrane protein